MVDENQQGGETNRIMDRINDQDMLVVVNMEIEVTNLVIEVDKFIVLYVLVRII